MVVRKTTPVGTPSVAKAKPAAVAEKIKAAPAKAAKPATSKPAVVGAGEAVAKPALIPGAPEARKAVATKRRLSKAFSRPLDKKLKPAQPVRERFTLLDVEYAQLAVLKKRLADQGVAAKKSDFVRAGLALVSVLDDAQLLALLAKVPPLG